MGPKMADLGVPSLRGEVEQQQAGFSGFLKPPIPWSS